ncbi:MAG TPA: hypothetical protein VKR55_11165 [Bradyrhizobium sp.]|uniref:hypothetical protein n=1 Tax=Bradyrhizobium sp. TaxID=376 RepID=UPI002BCCF65B|nr:hypothetical protein [Bradyrhizobium sp.]HLZ02696.1 hypothetical protein [Bradyrhizobium sp.]
MSWMKDRDALIAQTMAFVQSVTGRKEEAGRTSMPFGPPSAEAAVMEALELTPPKAKPPVLEPVRTAASPPPLPADTLGRFRTQGELANEIRARIASFRAHQERFNRERDEYFAATLARLRAAIKDASPPQPGK